MDALLEQAPASSWLIFTKLNGSQHAPPLPWSHKIHNHQVIKLCWHLDREYLNPRQCAPCVVYTKFMIYSNTIFSQNTVFRAECSLCVLPSFPRTPYVCSACRFKSSVLQYFLLDCMFRRIHHHLSCESVSAQYLLVRAMCWPRATREMEAVLLQVIAHRISGLHRSVY